MEGTIWVWGVEKMGRLPSPLGNNALVKKTQSGTLRELIMGSVNRPAAVSAIVSSGVSWQALHKVLHNLGPYGLV